MSNRSTYVCECNKLCNICEHLGVKNCSCQKLLIGKLVLEYKNEILNTFETSLDDKKSNIQRKIIV